MYTHVYVHVYTCIHMYMYMCTFMYICVCMCLTSFCMEEADNKALLHTPHNTNIDVVTITQRVKCLQSTIYMYYTALQM